MTNSGTLAEDRRIDSILLKMAIAKLQYFSADIAKLRAEVAELKGMTAEELSRRVPSMVDIDADAVGPFERGFYGREFDPQGRPFRWTGDGEIVEWRFFINRNVANRFSITGYTPEGGSIGAVRAFVDYSPVPLDIRLDGNQVVLSGEIPPVALESRASLTLWAPDRVAPEVADGRTLWFIFSRLAVHPIEDAEAAVAQTNGDADREAADELPAAPEGEGIAAAAEPRLSETAPDELPAAPEGEGIAAAAEPPLGETAPPAGDAAGASTLSRPSARATPGRRSRRAEGRR